MHFLVCDENASFRRFRLNRRDLAGIDTHQESYTQASSRHDDLKME